MHVKSINVVKEFKCCSIGVIIYLFLQIKKSPASSKEFYFENVTSETKIFKKIRRNKRKNVYKVYRQLDHDFHVSSIEN